MTKMELSKESLFLLAKKITNKNTPFPLVDTSNILKLNSESILNEKERAKSLKKDDNIVNNEQKTFKKVIRFKNKFLEKNNIQINEEKMRNILTEKKRKLKLALSQKNNKANNQTKKNIQMSAILKLNTSKDKNKKYEKENNTSIKEETHQYINFEKDNNINNNYNNSNYYNSFTNIQLNTDNDNRLNNNRLAKRKIYNSNSGFLERNKPNYSFLTNNNSLRQIETSFNFNKLNYDNNKDDINTSIHRYSSKKKNNEHNIIDIKEGINNENEIKPTNINNNNINNNININININNSNNDNGRINKLSKKKSSRNTPKYVSNNNKKQTNYITYYKNNTTNRNNIIRKLPTYSNINNISIDKDLEPNLNIDFKEKEIIIPSSEKIIKKYISHKSYYNTKLNEDKRYEYKEFIEEEEENDDIDNNSNEYIQNRKSDRIKDIEKYNIYNINLNFISDKETDVKNNDYYTTNDLNYKHVSKNKINNSKQKKKSTQKVGDYYISHGKNNQLYSIKTDNNNINNSFNDNIYENNLIRNKNVNHKNSIKKIRNNNSVTEIKYNYDYDYNNTMEAPIPINHINNKKDIIQLEDLLILEGKLFHILNCLKNGTVITKMCVEWWSFYTFSSFYGKFPKLFPKIKDHNIITDYEIAHDAVILELLSVIVTYEVLSDVQSNKYLIDILIYLITEIHQNFLVECDYILSKVNVQSINNIWINKLKNLILSKKQWNKRNAIHLDLIKEGNDIIQDYIQDIINWYSNNTNNINTTALNFYNNNISKLNLIQLNMYFNEIINKENIKIGRTFSYIIKTKFNKKEKNYENTNIIVPYLPKEIEGNKKYTLVLDLDETLISFRFNKKYQGILRTRPGLYNFLKDVGTKYEMVIFTAGTQQYADPIIDIIEKDKEIFVKRLYRQHTVFIDNIFVKDLTKLGRDLSKIIIVDNMPQNFTFQKENGIFIKNYFGQDDDDTALIDLTPILLRIASKPNNDVRKELKKYREQIFTQITTNLK